MIVSVICATINFLYILPNPTAVPLLYNADYTFVTIFLFEMSNIHADLSNLSVEEIEALNQTDLVRYLNLKKDELFLKPDHIEALEAQYLAGSDFLVLTKEKLINAPYNFLNGPAGRIARFVSQLNKQSKFYHNIV
jgi:hypothetical protein